MKNIHQIVVATTAEAEVELSNASDFSAALVLVGVIPDVYLAEYESEIEAKAFIEGFKLNKDNVNNGIVEQPKSLEQIVNGDYHVDVDDGEFIIQSGAGFRARLNAEVIQIISDQGYTIDKVLQIKPNTSGGYQIRLRLIRTSNGRFYNFNVTLSKIDII